MEWIALVLVLGSFIALVLLLLHGVLILSAVAL